MGVQQEQIAALTQAAADQYSRGEFPEALESWSRLLLIDPENTEALHGLELCARASTGATVEVPATVGPTVEESLAALDSAVGEAGGLEDALADISADGVVEGMPPAADDPFDLDLTALEMSGTPMSHETPALDPDPIPETTGPLLEQQAAAELQARVLELMTDASAFYERGDKEGAMSILSRLFILDEENAEASALRTRIRIELEEEDVVRQAQHAAAAEQSAADEQMAADEIGRDDSIVGNAAEEMESFEPDSVLSMDGMSGPLDASAFGDADPADDLMPDLMAAGSFADPALEGLDTSGAAEADDSRLPSEVGTRWNGPELGGGTDNGSAESASWARNNKRKLLMIASGVIGILIIGALLALRGTDPPDSSGSNEPPTVQKPQPGSTDSGPDLGKPVAAGTDTTSPGTEVAPTTNSEELMARAEAAIAEQDYAAAVVAFNELLAVDPGNLQATQRLQVAGNLYREQKVVDEKWEKALQDFENGNYRAALGSFYRIESRVEDATLTRYKRNGWFNLGVQALEIHDCKSARQNFREALTLDATDAGANQGLQLARDCTGKQEGLALRVLNE